jgi:hypothetical protein
MIQIFLFWGRKYAKWGEKVNVNAKKTSDYGKFKTGLVLPLTASEASV